MRMRLFLGVLATSFLTYGCPEPETPVPPRPTNPTNIRTAAQRLDVIDASIVTEAGSPIDGAVLGIDASPSRALR
jgi:hypothetical protein